MIAFLPCGCTTNPLIDVSLTKLLAFLDKDYVVLVDHFPQQQKPSLSMLYKEGNGTYAHLMLEENGEVHDVELLTRREVDLLLIKLLLEKRLQGFSYVTGSVTFKDKVISLHCQTEKCNNVFFVDW
ncbi:hypothetical protein [Priestia koreensis]|uniref:hypothetical protein n=1 Tax=Priestia koreensis TaxID=284581 RepID=UPI00345A2BA2